MFCLCPVIIRKMLGDVRCKYIPLMRTFSAGLVVSPSDKICVYTAMLYGDVRRADPAKRDRQDLYLPILRRIRSFLCP